MSGAVELEAELRAELITYAVRYGGMCRDCADMVDGVCEHKGTPCDTKVFRAAIAHALAAWDYGGKHGFCTEIGPLAALRADNERLGRERDEAQNNWHITIDMARLHQSRAEAAEAERDTLLAQVEALKVDLENRAEWHRCSCPEPCDDYGVFPGGCAGRYREDYRALIARAALTKEPS